MLLDAIEQVAGLCWAAARRSLDTMLLPQACLPGDAVLCRDGSLVTVLTLAGSRSAMGDAELDRFVALAGERLNGLFIGPGHALHAVIERDPDRLPGAVADTVDRQSRQARALGLDLGDVLEERRRHLGALTADERASLALWTRPSALGVEQARRDRRTMRARLKRWAASPEAAQCALALYDSLPARHAALIEGVESALADTGVVARRLDGAAALAELRLWLVGETGGDRGWRPAGVDDAVPPRLTDPPAEGAAAPPLAPQLLISDPERRGAAVVLGDRLHGALDMLLGPRQPKPFAELLRRLAEAGLPFRLSLLVEGGGPDGVAAQLGKISAEFLAFSSDDTRARRDALRELAAERSAGRAVVRFRVGMLTWVGRAGDPAELERRVARLRQIGEGWGETVMTSVVGDPLESLAATVPAFGCFATGVASLAPLADVLRLLPVSSLAPPAPARPNHVFRSDTGKALPISFEGAEDFRFDLIHGRPGGGKSVLMNTLSLGFALRGGTARLPLVAVVDVGPSSSGLIALLRSALPVERRHEAAWLPFDLSVKCAVNPFDTPLGCRSATAAEREFLANLLSLMLTAPGEDGPRDGVREAIAPAVAAAYDLRSDAIAGADPARYARGLDAEVDAALDRDDVRLEEDPFWWEVVDALFAAGDAVAAARAQRHAVPTMIDIISAVRGEAVQAVIGRAAFGVGGETVTAAIVRILTSLSGTWPALFSPTAVDLGDVRVAAIDVGPAAAARGSAEADRQAAAVYMLARHALTRGWWHSADDTASAPEPYRAWHAARAREMAETPKRLAYDEFHRTAGIAAVRAQVERDVREGRKLRVSVCLASQRSEDFDAALVSLATHIWVIGAGGGKATEIAELGRVFGLGETAAESARLRLTGPGSGGAPALLIGTEEGRRSELLVWNAPGPSELWALSTAPRDVALRQRVHLRLGPAAARAALARAFPTGTAAGRIADELAGMEDAGGDDATEAAVLERIADDLVAAATGTAH